MVLGAEVNDWFGPCGGESVFLRSVTSFGEGGHVNNPEEPKTSRSRVVAGVLANFALGIAFLFVAFLGLDRILDDGLIKTALQWLLAGFSMVLFGGIPRPLKRVR